MAWNSSFRQNYRTTFFPTVPTSAAGISHVVADVEAPGGEKWEYLKSGGKQWQATPKNLPRMQRTRAIPVAWLSSGLCPDRPKGWIPIILIIIVCLVRLKRKHHSTSAGEVYSETFHTRLSCRDSSCQVPNLQREWHVDRREGSQKTQLVYYIKDVYS